jgi:hypothetical protein
MVQAIYSSAMAKVRDNAGAADKIRRVLDKLCEQNYNHINIFSWYVYMKY